MHGVRLAFPFCRDTFTNVDFVCTNKVLFAYIDSENSKRDFIIKPSFDNELKLSLYKMEYFDGLPYPYVPLFDSKFERELMKSTSFLAFAKAIKAFEDAYIKIIRIEYLKPGGTLHMDVEYVVGVSQKVYQYKIGKVPVLTHTKDGRIGLYLFFDHPLKGVGFSMIFRRESNASYKKFFDSIAAWLKSENGFVYQVQKKAQSYFRGVWHVFMKAEKRALEVMWHPPEKREAVDD